VALLGSGHGCFPAHGPRQHGHCLTIAKRIESFDRSVPIEQTAGLFDQPRCEDVRAAAVESVVKGGARRVETDPQ
jgi:hypothetical protein